MCFCTSKRQTEISHISQIIQPISTIFPNPDSFHILNYSSQNTLFEIQNSSSNALNLNELCQVFQQAQDLAPVFKEKSCPIIHLEKDNFLTNLYSLGKGNILIFRSEKCEELSTLDLRMQEILTKLVQYVSDE